MSFSENKIICLKKDIILTLNENTKIYNLNFNTKSINFDLQKFANFNIYKLLFELNKDLVESIEIINQPSDNEADILIIFKEIGDNIKIPKYFIYITINKTFINNEIIFKCKNNYNISDISYKINNSYKSICEYSILKIKKNNNIINFNYAFKVNLSFQESDFIKKIISLIIKKIFYRLKVFIENSISQNNDI